jgi:hypothetical protein
MARRYARVRNLEHVENLWSVDGPDGLKFLRKISHAKGKLLVADGRAIQHLDPDTNECLGYQLIACGSAVGVRAGGEKAAEAESKASSCVLTPREAEAAIGLYGPSRTENLPEWSRLQRIAKGLREMDMVEAAKVKLESFAPRIRFV